MWMPWFCLLWLLWQWSFIFAVFQSPETQIVAVWPGWNSPLFFLVQVVRLFSLQPKSLRRNVNGIPWFHWSMIHGFVHISRSILYGYFYPLVFWYQWEYLLTSKEFSFLQGTWDWQWFFPLLHGHHDKNRAPVVSFDMCPGQGPQGPCGSRDFNRHLWPQTVCLEGWCQLLVVSNISISDIP